MFWSVTPDMCCPTKCACNVRLTVAGVVPFQLLIALTVKVEPFCSGRLVTRPALLDIMLPLQNANPAQFNVQLVFLINVYLVLLTITSILIQFAPQMDTFTKKGNLLIAILTAFPAQIAVLVHVSGAQIIGGTILAWQSVGIVIARVGLLTLVMGTVILKHIKQYNWPTRH